LEEFLAAVGQTVKEMLGHVWNDRKLKLLDAVVSRFSHPKAVTSATGTVTAAWCH